jgi:hypothetical protein
MSRLWRLSVPTANLAVLKHKMDTVRRQMDPWSFGVPLLIIAFIILVSQALGLHIQFDF